jgi:CRP/FNR family cyclic AMP-dependent transcriptional regulator
MHPAILKQIPLFKGLGEADINLIAQHAVDRRVSRNTVLLREGEQPNSLYVVVTGRVKVYVCDEDGKELVLGILGSGEFFGELALIDGEPRSATVMTIEDATISAISKADFRNILEHNPHLSINILRTLARRVRVLNDNVRDLALLDVYGRVARTLLRLASDKDGQRVVQGVTHQEIGKMIGASREMVSRVISALKADDFIRVDGRAIVLNDKLVNQE